jgi:hypothetical protein
MRDGPRADNSRSAALEPPAHDRAVSQNDPDCAAGTIRIIETANCSISLP